MTYTYIVSEIHINSHPCLPIWVHMELLRHSILPRCDEDTCDRYKRPNCERIRKTFERLKILEEEFL